MADGDIPAWHAGLDDDGKAWATASGLINLNAEEAARASVKSYRELQKLHGGLAAGDVVKLPKEGADEATVKSFYQKVGVPADPTGYGFDGLVFSDGTSPEAAFQDAARAAAHKANLTPAQLKSFVSSLMPYMEQVEKDDQVASQAALADAAKALEAEWGPRAANNKFISTSAMKTLGVTDETIAEVQKSPLGYAATMKLFLRLGEMLGEAKFVPAGGNVPGAMSKEQARSQLETLGKDEAWVKRFLAGGAAEMDQRRNLIRIIAGA